MAESQSNSSSGAAGVLGMGEVFFDTVLLCTLTALAVLCVSENTPSSLGAVDIVLYAICSVLGDAGACVLFLLISAFYF